MSATPAQDADRRALGLAQLAQTVLGRVLALDPERGDVLRELDGKRLLLVIVGEVPIRLTVAVEGAEVRVTAGEREPVDVEVRGRASALLALLARGGIAIPAAHGLTVSGDVALLESARRAAARLRPDWEEPLARTLGDAMARPLAEGLRGLAAIARRSVREIADASAEYLREESGLVPHAEGMDEFAAELRRLRDGVERLDKRLAAIEGRLDARG